MVRPQFCILRVSLKSELDYFFDPGRRPLRLVVLFLRTEARKNVGSVEPLPIRIPRRSLADPYRHQVIIEGPAPLLCQTEPLPPDLFRALPPRPGAASRR